MQIKDVAALSGFTAATLRYYEEIGLVPEPARTPSGYRSYDDRVLERLAFIARAKQLGCTLDEIADLTTAWEGGTCGPVQDRLRVLVHDKQAVIEAQIAQLETLSAELRRAAVALEQHRPDGPCDDRCGCVTDPAREAATVGIALSAKPAAAAAAAVPIACALRPDALGNRLDEWERVLAHAAERVEIPSGVRVEFTADVALEELSRLAAAEHDCCEFMQFAITIDTRGVALEATAPDDAASIVEALFGVPR